MTKHDKKNIIDSSDVIKNGGKVAYIEIVVLNYERQERAEVYLKKISKQRSEIITKHIKNMYEELAQTFEKTN